MEETYVVQADYEEALKLADVYSILQELKSVMETCTRLRQLLKAEQKDWLLIESLWTAALIRYSRCFASGKRHGLSEDIYKDLPGDAVGVHRLYENLRNKHIAHSVNPFEQVKVFDVNAVVQTLAPDICVFVLAKTSEVERFFVD